jgi:hypothetical protein
MQQWAQSAWYKNVVLTKVRQSSNAVRHSSIQRVELEVQVPELPKQSKFGGNSPVQFIKRQAKVFHVGKFAQLGWNGAGNGVVVYASDVGRVNV